ncbi:MAG: hypothetical protein Q4A62_01090 [Eikenella sp.]|nr:hypothetical protein [Eikenella sp.]
MNILQVFSTQQMRDFDRKYRRNEDFEQVLIEKMAQCNALGRQATA